MVKILSPSCPSSSSSPMCWEWPGWVCLVSRQCQCLCSTTYGPPVKSSSPPKPTGQQEWSRSVWTSGNMVLPVQSMICVLCAYAGLNYYRVVIIIILIIFAIHFVKKLKTKENVFTSKITCLLDNRFHKIKTKKCFC